MRPCTLSHFSGIQLFVTLWTVAHQVPLSMGLYKEEYWAGLSCPPPGDLPNPGIEPASLMSFALAGRYFTTSATWEAHLVYTYTKTCISYSVFLSGNPTVSFIICTASNFKERARFPLFTQSYLLKIVLIGNPRSYTHPCGCRGGPGD